MITKLDDIIEHHYLNPEIAAEVAKTSRNVWRNEEQFGDTYVAATFTLDEFVREVKAADPNPEASRQAHFERRRQRTADNSVSDAMSGQMEAIIENMARNKDTY